ncbi:MAG TPA: TfuA-like protein [Nitrososphaeraceae archaeon]|jgi:TfuA protein|nr:TfuA-like protein [Nitrososphaeraceae archaeon]
MNLPIVFLGPSLKLDKAKQIINAEFKPPAKKGDFIKLSLMSETRKIVLIDGVFLQDYPPTPIEVFQVISKSNFKVYGASSIGALRAVELEKFGMEGIGKIFELYKKEIINSDDEIAVTFDSDYNLISEAMIDIRYNIFLAWKHQIIDKETKQIMTKIAKRIYFPYRSYDNIIEKSLDLFPSCREFILKFKDYILSNRISLKELDAQITLKYVSSLIEKNT